MQLTLPGFCECGCGAPTNVGRRFRQGHHVRVRHHRPMLGRAGVDSPTWRGGRKVRTDGYIALTVAPGTAELEHRLVMAEHLGRPLVSGEVVHHIDRNRANNAVDNLRLYSSHAEHMRVEHAA